MGDEQVKGIRESIIELDFEGGRSAVARVMERGLPPQIVIDELRAGMDEVGRRFEEGEYFLPELVVAGEIAREIAEAIEPHLQAEGTESRGVIVLATVKGDIHNIGKNIAGVMLAAAGFRVIDLGESVPSSKVVEAVRQHRPDILGLSALLTITMVEMGPVIEALKEAGLRDGLKVIVGGAPVTDEFAKKIGADYHARDVVDGVNKCRNWAEAGA
jgi:5-methyltetrahydrofolate--homocysteine methyltransferase